MIDVCDHEDVLAVVPLNVTVPVLAPKFVPVIVIDAPTLPSALFERDEMCGLDWVHLGPGNG